MSFLEHLEELRIRLMRAMVSLVVGFGVCWAFRERIFHFITEPLRVAYPTVQFIATAPTEAFMLYMKMSFFVGIFVVVALRPVPDLGVHRPRPLPARASTRGPSSASARCSSSWAARSATTSCSR